MIASSARSHGILVAVTDDGRDEIYQQGAIKALADSGTMIQIAEESLRSPKGEAKESEFDPSTLLACQMLRDLHELLNVKRAEIAALKLELNTRAKA